MEMHFQKKATFTSDGRLFAYINEKDNLLIYETSPSKLINDNLDWKIKGCSSIRWIPKQRIHNNKKKAKLCQDYIFEETLLAAGNVKGDILIYNIEAKNLFLHLVGRHNGAINDMCLYTKNNSFFTCSSDQHIAIWDISTGSQISKWKVEDPISSICVIDDENLLSSYTTILWWSISKKTVLKKFSGHVTEITKLLPVNVDSMKSYFLSAAIDDTKINAWSLTSSACEPFVASFSLPLSPLDMDISKVSSKDKPLMLTAVTRDGHLHIFEHALNGNMNEAIQPEVSVKINQDCDDFTVLLVKLTDNADGCIIAYSSSKSAIVFKHVKIKELLQKNKENIISVKCETPVKSLVKDSNKSGKNSSVNGLSDSVLSGYKSRLRSSMKCSSTVPGLNNPTEKDVSTNQLTVNEDVDLHDPKSAVDALLKAIEVHNDNIIEKIFKNSDPEYMSSVVQTLPTSSLKIILDEINHRLLQRYSVTLCRWLKEILQVHLRYLMQCDDAIESLHQTRRHLSSLNISETILKMTAVQGQLLSLQIQDSSSDESDSDDIESMEL